MIIRKLGVVEYTSTLKAMRDFTETRTPQNQDEIWLLEHPSVFTLGQAGKPQHLLRQTPIELVKSDRGGQITYHGPGQLIAYTLLDIKRAGLGVRELVRKLEQAVIELLRIEYQIEAYGRVDAPGVYVGEAKIAALGLRIRNGCSYHGLSLNVNMDLAPFGWINPCGYQGLKVTQLKDFGIEIEPFVLQDTLAYYLQQQLPQWV